MWVVERARVDSVLGKLVFRVPGVTVLEWFQRVWIHPDPQAVLDAEIGGGAYGFDSIFDAVQEHDLPCPRTLDELRDLLDEHLYVEYDDDPIRLDERGLRVRTDDDEVDLAYYFLEDAAVDAYPDRLEYLVSDSWPLPSGSAGPGATFTPGLTLRTIGPPWEGPDSVYVVLVSLEHPADNGTNLDRRGVTVFPGVTLSGLTERLRKLDGPLSGDLADAELLRSLAATGGGLDDMMARYLARRGGHERSRLAAGEHLVQAVTYIDDFYGYEQLFLFDTRWAAAHPALAKSLIRYGDRWDPFED